MMKKWHGALAGAVALIALGCGSGAADDPDAKKVEQAAGASTAATTEAAADEAAPTTAAAEQPLKASDIELTIKITKKQCFGSAGCNVTYHIVAATAFTPDSDKEYSVTYEVSGVEDGPQINTFTIQGDKYSYDEEELAETKSKNSKLKAKVTSVEES